MERDRSQLAPQVPLPERLPGISGAGAGPLLCAGDCSHLHFRPLAHAPAVSVLAALVPQVPQLVLTQQTLAAHLHGRLPGLLQDLSLGLQTHGSNTICDPAGKLLSFLYYSQSSLLQLTGSGTCGSQHLVLLTALQVPDAKQSERELSPVLCLLLLSF